MAEPRVLKLQSPAYGEPIYYKWPLVITKKHDEATEIVDTIRLVCEDFPELKYAVENTMLKDYDPLDYDSMNQLCQRYNKAIRNILSLWKGRAPPPRMYKPPSKDLLRHIINLCYSHAIKEPEKLNIYEPFSPEVYGETSFDMVARILDEVQNATDETFIDLGSGVGQVVLQAAASSQFKECFGVEKAETPAMYAKLMEREFKKWMNWYGKTYTDFSLEKGDFLEDKWINTINECGVVFVNNFAFGPIVNHHLKSRFQTMKEGSRVISSREFCPMNFKFNKRNLSELGAMMRVTEIKPRREEASVSWTGNHVSYYLHVVDRTRLEKYFSILKKRKEGQDLDEDELSLYSESNYSIDTNGTMLDVETLEDNLDDLYLGTTTRHQWQLLTDTIKQSKKEAKDSADIPIVEKRGRKKKIQSQLLQKKSGKVELKNKILRKYGKQAYKKAMRASQEQEDDEESSHEFVTEETDESDDEYEVKVKKKKAQNKKTLVSIQLAKRQLVPSKNKNTLHKKPAGLPKVEKDIDAFLCGMKKQYLEFIERMNTKQYADRLKVMIECETAKKKLLQREIIETERVVQNLISDGLTNFSSRLVELDVAVKTPVELLSQSTALAEKRQQLENKVIAMEIEVFNLEAKHRGLCAARDSKNRVQGMEPILDSEEDDLVLDSNESSSKSELTTKLCGAILTALNHRRSLIDKQSSLSEQISILEKISNPEQAENESSIVDIIGDDENHKQIPTIQRPKPRPVAFVPPRMLSQDKKNTLSPETTVIFSTGDSARTSSDHSDTPVAAARRPRGRPRKRPNNIEDYQRSSSTQSDSSQGSKIEFDERPSIQTATEQRRTPLNDINSVMTNNMQAQHAAHYTTYQVQEDRSPIRFPTKLYDHDNTSKTFSKDFLKTTGKLLSAAAPKWRPVDELWVPFSLSRHKTSNTKVSETPKLKSPAKSDALTVLPDRSPKVQLGVSTSSPQSSQAEQDVISQDRRRVDCTSVPIVQENRIESPRARPYYAVDTVLTSRAELPNEVPTMSSTVDILSTSLTRYTEAVSSASHQGALKQPCVPSSKSYISSLQSEKSAIHHNISPLKRSMYDLMPSPKHNIYDNLQFGSLLHSKDERNNNTISNSESQHHMLGRQYQLVGAAGIPNKSNQAKTLVAFSTQSNIQTSHSHQFSQAGVIHSVSDYTAITGSARNPFTVPKQQPSTVDIFSSAQTVVLQEKKSPTKEKRGRKKKHVPEKSFSPKRSPQVETIAYPSIVVSKPTQVDSNVHHFPVDIRHVLTVGKDVPKPVLHYPSHMLFSNNFQTSHHDNGKVPTSSLLPRQERDANMKSTIQPIYCPTAIRILKRPPETQPIPSVKPSADITNTATNSLPLLQQLPLLPSNASVISLSSAVTNSKSKFGTTNVAYENNVHREALNPAYFLSQLAGRKRGIESIPGGGHLTFLQTTPSSLSLVESAANAARMMPPPTKKQKGRKPKKAAAISILPAPTTSLPSNRVFVSSNSTTTPTVFSFLRNQETSRTDFATQQLMSSTSPLIISQAIKSNPKDAGRSQVISISMSQQASALNNMIIPKTAPSGTSVMSINQAAKPVQSRPISYVGHPHLVLLPMAEGQRSTSQQSSNNVEQGDILLERRQSMTSPTFPPPQSRAS